MARAARDLGVGGARLRPGGLDLGLCLADARHVVGVVEAEEDVPRADGRVLGDDDLGHRAGDPRRDRDHVRLDEGVVGGLVAAGEEGPHAGGRERDRRDEADAREDAPLPAAARGGPGGLGGAGRRVLGHGVELGIGRGHGHISSSTWGAADGRRRFTFRK